MSDRIKREDAIKAMAKAVGRILYDAEEISRHVMNSIPSAENKGEWIITEQDNGHKWTHRKCSECGKGIIEPLGVSRMNFCPNCGARMKGADDE